MAQQVGAFVVLAESLGSVPSAHIVAHNYRWLLVSGDPTPFSQWAPGMLVIQTYLQANTLTYKNKKKL